MMRARITTRLATDTLIRRREITPTPCRDCGSATVETHHTDYADPRAVVFLCNRCHDHEHRRLAAARPTGDRATDHLRQRFVEIVYGLTQHELSDRLGMSQATVSRFIRGERTPTLQFLAGLSRAYPDLRELVDRVVHGEDAGEVEAVAAS